MPNLRKKSVKRPWIASNPKSKKSWGGDTSIYRTKKWREERKIFLTKLPDCIACLRDNKKEPARVVDHIKNIKQNPHIDFWDKTNWQGLCHRHHNSKTRREQNGKNNNGGL